MARRKPKAADVTRQADDEGPRAYAHDLVTTPSAQNSAALEPWAVFGELDLSKLVIELRNQTRTVSNEGDMRAPEAMLYGQAVALQTIFTALSRRAALNVGEYMNAAERYLRLALKAQAQCRATLETLHEMKNPRPVAFVRQANIAHGPQQVNNGPSSQDVPDSAGARAGKSASEPNELIEDGTHGITEVDARAAAATGRTDQGLVPVGALDRPPNR
jgi:hypothetical protein